MIESPEADSDEYAEESGTGTGTGTIENELVESQQMDV
jgi:hypothetical protein